MDYFKKILVDISDEDIVASLGSIDTIKAWNEDVEKYREFSIRQYNKDTERATDIFCLRNFLNQYTISITVFGLHSDLDRKTFNRLINMGWLTYNGDIE